MSELFEQEVALEKRSSWGPLILVLALVGSIVGGIGYYWFQMKKGLSQDEATYLVTDHLKSKDVSLHFRTGKVVAGMDEQPKDPHYRILAKAGFLDVKDAGWNAIVANVTQAGDKAFSSIAGFKKWQNADKTTSYEIPLAKRKLIKIDSIELNGPSAAKVEYEWKWDANVIGDLFDASGAPVQSFNTWDRQKLINRYGADFYHAEAKKEVLRLTKGDKGWKVSE